MSRQYTQRLSDLPDVSIPDWELIARLEALFRPYLPVTQPRGGYLMFTAEDNRGEYTAPTTAELREEAERQEQMPTRIRVYVDGKTVFGDWYELGVYAEPGRSSALFYSSNEELVNHVAARTRELFAQAAGRAPREGLPTASVPDRRESAATPTPERRSKLAPAIIGHLGRTTLGIASSVIAGLILYLLIGR